MNRDIHPGQIFNSIEAIDADAEELKRKVVEATAKLLDSDTETNPDRPGMLLGKIQSGKTAAFIRILGLAFDNGFDIAVVLTKGTVALTDQTVRRLNRAFRTAIESDWVEVCDIMQHQGDFTRYELRKKLIIVAKKQKHNLERIIALLTEKHPDLREKRMLIVDDEADYASIGFRSVRDDSGERSIDAAKIPKLINELRSKVRAAAFLQVTATPYALYLQPETYELSFSFKPARPAFTIVLPTYPEYVGSDFYFGDDDHGEPKAPFVYQEIGDDELADMKPKKKTGRADGRSFQISEVLNPKKIPILRHAILNFIIGAAVRRSEQGQIGDRAKKYSFIVHTDTHRQTHEWQKSVVIELIKKLEELAENARNELAGMFKASFADLEQSIVKMGFSVPDEHKIIEEAILALQEGQVAIDTVNSDNDVKNMLDENGQLRLRAPMSIFIGGQALDRGITVDNLIGFYYGRNPGRFQQDTVLQHSRMYGNRSREDLSVTRFYTTGSVYEILRRINEIDEVLRNALIAAGGDHGVVFIQRDEAQRIIPCSPNKILLSATTTLRGWKRLLPFGFQVLPGYKLGPHTLAIDKELDAIPKSGEPVLINVEKARAIISESYAGFDSPKASNIGHNEDEILSALSYLTNLPENPQLKNRVYVLARENRNSARIRSTGRFENSPDTPHVEGEIAKQNANEVPVLMMFRQNGEDASWRSGPFWWPVLLVQRNIHPAIYASETQELEFDATSNSQIFSRGA